MSPVEVGQVVRTPALNSRREGRSAWQDILRDDHEFLLSILLSSLIVCFFRRHFLFTHS